MVRRTAMWNIEWWGNVEYDNEIYHGSICRRKEASSQCGGGESKSPRYFKQELGDMRRGKGKGFTRG